MIALPEKVATKLASDTAFGAMFLTVNLTGVLDPVTEDVGAEDTTEISAVVALRSLTTELRTT